MEHGSGEKPPSIRGRLGGFFNRGGAKPVSNPPPAQPLPEESLLSSSPPLRNTEPVVSGLKQESLVAPAAEGSSLSEPEAIKTEKPQTPEKEPESWFVVDGETRKRMKERLETEAMQKEREGAKWEERWSEISKQYRYEIGLREPINLFTPQDGVNLLKALNFTVGNMKLRAGFVRSDGKTVEVHDDGTTGIVIEIPKERTTTADFLSKGHSQLLGLGEAGYLWAKLQQKLQGAGVKLDLDTEGIIVGTNRGYGFPADVEERILAEVKAKGTGRGGKLLTSYYNDLVESSNKFPEMREQLGVKEGEELKPL